MQNVREKRLKLKDLARFEKNENRIILLFHGLSILSFFETSRFCPYEHLISANGLILPSYPNALFSRYQRQRSEHHIHHHR